MKTKNHDIPIKYNISGYKPKNILPLGICTWSNLMEAIIDHITPIAVIPNFNQILYFSIKAIIEDTDIGIEEYPTMHAVCKKEILDSSNLPLT